MPFQKTMGPAVLGAMFAGGIITTYTMKAAGFDVTDYYSP
jgi:hypothetical protein